MSDIFKVYVCGYCKKDNNSAHTDCFYPCSTKPSYCFVVEENAYPSFIIGVSDPDPEMALEATNDFSEVRYVDEDGRSIIPKDYLKNAKLK